MSVHEEPPEDLPESQPVPVALELAHHDVIAGLSQRYRDLIGAPSPYADSTEQPVTTPDALRPLAVHFAETSNSQVEFSGSTDRGFDFTYSREQYGDNLEFQVQMLVSELQAFGIGEVGHTDFAGNVTFIVTLPDGRRTEWFFRGTQESREARRFFNGIRPAEGPQAFDAYRLKFTDGMEGGDYTFWQPPDAEPLSQMLDDLGAEVYYTEDGFFVEFGGRDYDFHELPEDPRAVTERSFASARTEFRRQERIHAALPPVAPGHIRMFRGITGAYEERAPLTDAERAEFLQLQSNLPMAIVDDAALAARFDELRGRYQGQMGTPDLTDVLHQYAVGADATLMYVDLTPEEFERYRDKNAPMSIISGYSILPTGSVQWNSVPLAQVDTKPDATA